ncbi:MAG: hypothetical protein E6Q89_06870 [Bacteroidia bacterium]|nr:MAG: hypothetical protein E6Q89_06870 [Bacteroidia bacterium]
MKKIYLFVVFLLAFKSYTSAQSLTKNELDVNVLRLETSLNKSIFSNSYTPINYEEKYKKFKRMRNAGITLTALGTAATILGRAFLYGDKIDGANEIDQRVGGVMGIAFGVCGIAGGVTLWVIGSNKMQKYSSTVSFKPTQNGVGLAYQF